MGNYIAFGGGIFFEVKISNNNRDKRGTILIAMGRKIEISWEIINFYVF